MGTNEGFPVMFFQRNVRRNDLTIYDAASGEWWTNEIRWVRTLRNLVPARLAYFDQFIDWTGKEVLDLGCAGGFMAEAIYDRGARVSGIDPSSAAIAAARAHAALTDRNIRYDVGAGETLNLPDNSFDVVVCVDVLEHVSDVQRVLAEVARVLRPGGLLLFDTINRNEFATFVAVTLAENILRLLPPGTHDPALFIRPSELRKTLASVGFSVGGIAGLGPRGINRRGDLIFGRVPGAAASYIGSARKRGAI